MQSTNHEKKEKARFSLAAVIAQACHLFPTSAERSYQFRLP